MEETERNSSKTFHRKESKTGLDSVFGIGKDRFCQWETSHHPGHRQDSKRRPRIEGHHKFYHTDGPAKGDRTPKPAQGDRPNQKFPPKATIDPECLRKLFPACAEAYTDGLCIFR